MTTTINRGRANAVNRIRQIAVYRWLLGIAGVVLVLDQLTKLLVTQRLAYGTYSPPEAITVIEGFFYIVHIGNDGAAWGLLSGYSGLLTLFAIGALLFIYKFRHSLELQRGLQQVAFGLLVGGILGNLIDRQVHGHVIDFLDFHFPFSIPYVMPTGRYPSFNIADCGIVVGTFIYLLVSFRQTTRVETPEKSR